MVTQKNVEKFLRAHKWTGQPVSMISPKDLARAIANCDGPVRPEDVVAACSIGGRFSKKFKSGYLYTYDTVYSFCVYHWHCRYSDIFKVEDKVITTVKGEKLELLAVNEEWFVQYLKDLDTFREIYDRFYDLCTTVLRDEDMQQALQQLKDRVNFAAGVSEEYLQIELERQFRNFNPMLVNIAQSVAKSRFFSEKDRERISKCRENASFFNYDVTNLRIGELYDLLLFSICDVRAEASQMEELNDHTELTFYETVLDVESQPEGEGGGRQNTQSDPGGTEQPAAKRENSGGKTEDPWDDYDYNKMFK